MNNPASDLVSVIIPTVGRPSLFAAIESVQKQTHPLIEIIVVQDGADPATKAALEQCYGARICILTQEPAKSASACRNLGARHAHGRYLALLDDDDLFLPTKLQSDLQHAHNQPDDNFVVISSALVWWEGRLEKWPRRFPLPNERWSDYLFSRSWPARRPFLQTSCTFLPTSLLLRVPFNEQLRQHQDWDWLLDLETYAARLVPVQDAFVQYQIHNPASSISTRTHWTSSLAWLRGRKHNFSRETYAFFIATYVLDRARSQDGLSRGMLRTLLHEFRAVGRPTPLSCAFFIATFLQLRPLLRKLTGKTYSAANLRHETTLTNSSDPAERGSSSNVLPRSL